MDDERIHTKLTCPDCGGTDITTPAHDDPGGTCVDCGAEVTTP